MAIDTLSLNKIKSSNTLTTQNVYSVCYWVEVVRVNTSTVLAHMVKHQTLRYRTTE